MTCSSSLLKKEVSITYALYQSELGRYFIGQTPPLNPIGANTNSIAALVNSAGSSRNIYVNVITILNPSDTAITADFYLRVPLPSGTSVSTLVSSTNLTINPYPVPYGQIHYLATATAAPDGISIFSRIVSPSSTEIVDGGQIILPPGQSLIVYLRGLTTTSNIVVAFGWWEEYLNSCNCHHC